MLPSSTSNTEVARRHATSAVTTGSSPGSRDGRQASEQEPDSDGEVEGADVAGGVNGQAGIVSE